MENEYYVYAYVDPSNPKEPFYVGKGRGGRFRDASQKQRNKHLYNKINKLRSNGKLMKDITVFLEQNLTNEQALAKEVELIARYGRKDQGKGPLLNYTDGGDGVKGSVPKPILLAFKKEICDLYDQGYTMKEISEQYANTVSSVSYLFKILNKPRRRKGRRCPGMDIEQLITEYRKCPSVSRLARKLNCDHKYLRDLLELNGCEIIDARSLVLGAKRGRKAKQ